MQQKCQTPKRHLWTQYLSFTSSYFEALVSDIIKFNLMFHIEKQSPIDIL